MGDFSCETKPIRPTGGWARRIVRERLRRHCAKQSQFAQGSGISKPSPDLGLLIPAPPAPDPWKADGPGPIVRNKANWREPG